MTFEALRKSLMADSRYLGVHHSTIQPQPNAQIHQNLYPSEPSIGTIWNSRHDMVRDKMHNSARAGISAKSNSYATAVVMSGGYEDDKILDGGSVIYYTGAGGRDDKSGSHVSQAYNQHLNDSYNKSLQRNINNRKPVRVFNGFWTESGRMKYMYLGLYRVKAVEIKKGISGFKICQFQLHRLKHQGALPRNFEA